MKLFSRLVRPAPPAPAPTLQERIAALQSAPADVVVSTALGGHEAGLRVAAIRLLPDGEALRVLGGLAAPAQGALAELPAAVRRAAHERLAQLVDEGSIDIAAVCGDPGRWSDSMAVAALSKDPDRLGSMLAVVDDPAVLARLVTDGPSIRVRQSAAALLDDPLQLHELLPRVRGKDKTVYKLIRQKCDALLADQRRVEAAAREVAELCASLEQHGARPHDSSYAATLEGLTARWRALSTRPEQDIERRAELAIERCSEVIAAHEREVARLAAERAAEREAREARERALEAARRAAAEKAEAEARALADAAAAREAEERARAEQRATVAQLHSQVGSLIRLSSDALRRGNSRKAARFRQGIEETLLEAPALPPYLARNLQLLDERLNELRQWKDYVVAPKRIELIEEMEALVGSDEEPQALAEHIRALQQEWRTINKGIAGEVPADAERFQLAHQAAFKPCQEYFASLAAMRRENLEARKRVLERLQAFEASQDAEHTDHRLVAQVLREAPREWRSHSPVDREAGRPAEIQFHQAMDRLRKILNAWYERNEAEKKSLIEQARHLATAEDASQAIEAVKRLQASWKDTGPVSRDRSQALWDEFRDLCDSVYKRREQAYMLYAANLEAAKAQAVALCEQVEQAGNGPDAERLPAEAKVREWQAAFDALGELPRSDARGLRDRFEHAVSRYQAGLAQQGLRDAAAAESNLFEAGRLIRAYERAVMQRALPAECETLRNAAEAFIAGVRRWPAGGQQAVKQALARAGAAFGPDDEAREQALRLLCIRSEIFSSTPTPPGDEELRRDFQLRLLMESMGQANRMEDRDWDAMLAEWIGIGAITPDAHAAFEQRFKRSLAKRPVTRPRGSPFQDHDDGDARPRRDPGERGARRR